MNEIGPSFSVLPDIFLKFMKDNGGVLSEQDIAEVIILTASNSSWQLSNMYEAFRNSCRHLNWSIVLQKLDNPNFLVRNEDEFVALSAFFTNVSGASIPGSGLLKLWENKSCQVSILSFGLLHEKIDFLEFLKPEQQLPKEVVMPASGSWLCLNLFSTLLDLASSGLSIMVLDIFNAASAVYPEYVLLGFAQVLDPNTGIRAEVIRKTLQLFTGLPGSKPTSRIVMTRLAQLNPDLLLLLLRYSLKKSNSVEDILAIDEKLSILTGDIVKRIEEEGTLDELIGYWCVKADRSDFNLEEKLVPILSSSPRVGRMLCAFSVAHLETIRHRHADGGLLSVTSLTIIVNLLQKVKEFVPEDELLMLQNILNRNQGSAGNFLSSDFFGIEINQNAHQDKFGLDLASKDGNAGFDDVEEESNSYFQKIYTSDISIVDAIALFKKFKSSEKMREQEIFRCMIHNLFDEYRFFHKYPDRELNVTAKVFGSLIQNQLVSSITLGIALRYILEALRKDPEASASDEKMFRFGSSALEQFRQRLGEWPQYCSHLIQIGHFKVKCPELYMDAQRAVSSPSLVAQVSDQSHLSQRLNASADQEFDVGFQPSFDQSQMVFYAIDGDGDDKALEVLEAKSIQTSVGGDPTIDASSVTTGKGSKFRGMSIMDKMLSVNVETQASLPPPDAIRDQILFIVNNIAKDNFQSKIEDLRSVLAKDHYNWFANYLVVKRISTMPNLHPIYLNILDYLDSSELVAVILDTTYHNATKLLQSPNITTSSSERSLLRNLGIWLGQITLARNRPILQRRMDLKALLAWGYENARLIAVCSFVAKTIEGVKESRIFRPPNPWLMSILGVMRELYDIEDLKMNIKFEVQVLCKNINIRIEDIGKSSVLNGCKMPVKDSRNPDFSVKTTIPSSLPSIQSSPGGSIGSANPQLGLPGSQGDDEKQLTDASALLATSHEQTVIPNLASYVTINQSLAFFTNNPSQRRLVPLAIDRAIREIIQPVVERSVSIAITTSKLLVIKDFASEPNEIQLRNGAHLMVSNLAGSLALVTCKEPLRISIGNHLRTLLAQANLDQSTLDQIVQVCANDNLELGCILIEKASTEKAIRDIDETVTSATQARKKAREAGQIFYDTSLLSSKSFTDLPDILKPKQGGLSPSQYLVYEAFQRVRLNPPVAGQGIQDPSAFTADLKIPSGASNLSVNTLSMSQSLEAYQLIFNRLDLALKNVQIQASGRDVTISMLGGDHEIMSHFRDMMLVTQRTLPGVRSETAMAFCENVFKRLMESISSVDALRVEVMIGTIEALRDACGGVKKFAPDVISWLSHYANFNLSEEISRKFRAVLLLLLRAKLIRTQDLDIYFASCMDGGRNFGWVELALVFIRQCLSDGLGATYEFANSFDTVSKMRPANLQVRKQLQKWLTDLRAIAAPKEEQKPVSRDAGAREHVMLLLERWLRVWNTSNDQIFSQYLQLMHQYGVLKTEEAADKFFRISTELCVEACLKTAQTPSQGQGETPSAGALQYPVIDALSKLFLLLVRLADKEGGDMTVRVNLLSRILSAIGRTIIDDHDTKKVSKVLFDQRPYYRLLSNLSQDMSVPDPKSEPNPAMIPILTSYCQVYLALQPTVLPGFAFSWLQLISHRTFMPHLLLMKNQKCWPYIHRLIIALLLFLQPFLKNVQLNDSIRRLYKGTLRVLLVLLHDFPEFLCDFHLSFCDVIPPSCVQLRNLILSAFPRTMRLPDPFTPNLKVDLLPEINQPPRILTDYLAPLAERGIRQRIDSFMATKQPSDVPSSLVSVINSAQPNGTVAMSLPLLTSVVVYVGSQAVLQLQSKSPIQSSPAIELFKYLVSSFDAEGRYNLFNVMANQLRYPNSHTHYFSCVLLLLFGDSDNEFVQEQITRVLLERLIVHRPHPVRI